MMRAIDAHQHFWHYKEAEYGWIGEEMKTLRRDFLPADWHRHATGSNVVASVAVQARQSLSETRWLLELAAREPSISGVVGWADLRSPSFARQMEALQDAPKLAGLRHVIQDEAAGFMDDPVFNQNLARLEDFSLVFDLLLREHQLPEAIRLVDRHPAVHFVLDHAAKPRIASRELAPWQEQIVALARRPNLTCKVSGMVTEAVHDRWMDDDLRPYLDTLTAAFRPERLMAGSDWPVCLLASSFERWWTTLHGYFAHFSQDEQHAVFRGTAEAVYGLHLPPEFEAAGKELRAA